MTIKRIVYFVLGPFSERDYFRFGVDCFENSGFSVEVWDFTPLLFPHVYETIEVRKPFNYSRLRFINSKDQALEAVALLTEPASFVICFVPYGINTYFLYRALSRHKIKYSVFMANAMPFTACSSYRVREIIKRISLKEVFNKVRNLTAAKIAEIFFFKIKLAVLRIKPAALRLVGGEKSAVMYKYPVNEKTETVWLHTLDYDVFLKNEQVNPQVDENRIVFLDEDMVFYPGYLYLGVKPFVSPDQYFKLLCAFFKHLESQHKKRVIIAAHPRSQYEKLPDYFEGRQLIKGKTAELIRDSACVIVHASTSLNFAVLYNKPVIFVTTDELDRSIEGVWIHNVATQFNKSVYNLNSSTEADITGELTVDAKVYRKYKNDYIKKEGSAEQPFWQAVLNRIKSY
ncbi:MAG: hypothetical protein WC695_03910 [Candidatus Omnitrophota bacterium]